MVKFSLFCEMSFEVKRCDGTTCDMKWNLFDVYIPVRRGVILFLRNMIIRYWMEQLSSLPFSSTNESPHCSIELLPPLSCISLHKTLEFRLQGTFRTHLCNLLLQTMPASRLD